MKEFFSLTGEKFFSNWGEKNAKKWSNVMVIFGHFYFWTFVKYVEQNFN